MHHIDTYFTGERNQCLIGAVISLASIGLSLFLLQSTTGSFEKGVAFVCLPLGILLFVICAGVLIRIPSDVARVVSFFNNEPHRIQQEEIPRMEKVMRNFRIIKRIELGWILAGFTLFLLFMKDELWKGIGLALMVQGVVLYSFDYIAAARGKTYVDSLHGKGS